LETKLFNIKSIQHIILTTSIRSGTLTQSNSRKLKKILDDADEDKGELERKEVDSSSSRGRGRRSGYVINP
jgi:hypothetical protein